MKGIDRKGSSWFIERCDARQTGSAGVFPLPVLTEEIREADEFLKNQKGFGGSKESEQAQRAMYAVMIVSDQYAGTEQVNITVMTNTIDMLIAKQQASRISFFMNLLQFAGKLLPEGKKRARRGTEKG